MSLIFSALCVLLVGVLTPMLVAYAGRVDRPRPSNIVKNTAISSLTRTKLSADNSTNLANIIIQTDDNGVVLLHGSAASQALPDKAEAIARTTIGVKQVIIQASVSTDF